MTIVCGEKRSVEVVKVTEEMKALKAYDKLHVKRMIQCQLGACLKKTAEAEEEKK
jgi:large subunit ribosomal protein L13e